MLRAIAGREETPGELARQDPNDSQRTRMLKAVLKSVSKFSSSGLGRQNTSASTAAAILMGGHQDREPFETPRHKVLLVRQQSLCCEGSLSDEQEKHLKSSASLELDHECTDLASSSVHNLSQSRLDGIHSQSHTSANSSILANEMRMLELENDELHTPRLRELLEGSSAKVDRLCKRLRMVEESDKATRRPKEVATGLPEGIHLVSHMGDAEAAERSRKELAAVHWVSDNIEFKDLKDMSMFIDQSTSYQDLRPHFEVTYECHPGLPLLTDHALEDPGVWEKAVWGSLRIDGDAAEADSGGRAASRSVMPAQMPKATRFTRGGPGSWQTGGSKMRRDRSAPTLR